MTDVSESDLASIKARAAAATPGPWQWVRDDNDEPGIPADHEGADCSLRTTWTRPYESFPGEGPVFVTPSVYWEAEDTADAEFIAHARTDIPQLIAELEAAQLEVMAHQVGDGYEKGYEHGTLTALKFKERADAAEARAGKMAAELARVDALMNQWKGNTIRSMSLDTAQANVDAALRGDVNGWWAK